MNVMVQEPQTEQVSQLIVNDFNINVATANGSGSQTSNNMLIRSLYKMGIPVTGKNLFPSNIQGLPTWYNIRLSKDGFLARRERVEIMICMNGATVAEDMASVEPGGVILYDDTLPIANHRKDVKYYPLPVKELVKAANLPYNLQRYIANMVYVGVAAYLLEIEMDEIKAALAWNFGGKTKPIELNWGCLLYTSDAADERSRVNLGGRRIIKKKKSHHKKDNGSAQTKKRINSTRRRHTRDIQPDDHVRRAVQ